MNGNLTVDRLALLTISQQDSVLAEDTANNQKRIDLSTGLINLQSNDDFMALMDYLTKDEVIRLAELRLDPALIDAQRMDVENQLVCLSGLRGQLLAVHGLASHARQSIDKNNAFLEMTDDERTTLFKEASAANESYQT